jgi:hypothetical protein
MKKFEILRELLKCDAETRSEHMLLGGKMAPVDLLDAGLPQTFNLQKNGRIRTSLFQSFCQD